MKKEKQRALDLIRSNIASHGYHVYVIAGGPLPRFSYTIGLKEAIGYELIMPGSYFYSANEIKQIIDGVADLIKSQPSKIDLELKINSLGSFKLRKADDSWTKKLMLGALDFYSLEEISALQIIPDPDHWTIDIPDLSESWSIHKAPIWRWLNEVWSCQSISDRSVAVTNLRALRGEKITEATRWEDDQWELFAGSGPDTLPAEVRVVPLGMFLAFDTSLTKVVSLELGHALWRDKHETEWHIWG